MIKQIAIFLLTVILFFACTNDGDKQTSKKEDEVAVNTDTTTAIDKNEKTEGTPLTVVVNGLESDKAPVVVRVYTEANFLDKTPDKFKFRVKPQGGKVTHKVEGMNYGDVAIVAYQDMNDNDNLDRNGVGMPLEPYAFSNDFRPKVKAPDFSDCKFTYNEKSNTVTVNMPGKK